VAYSDAPKIRQYGGDAAKAHYPASIIPSQLPLRDPRWIAFQFECMKGILAGQDALMAREK
jgi:hypothetical protein